MLKRLDPQCEEFARRWQFAEQREIEGLFDKIFKCYYDFLYRFTQSLTSNKTMTEDIVQDVFLALWKKDNRSALHNLRGWLLRTAHYKVIDKCYRDPSRKDSSSENVLSELVASGSIASYSNVLVDEILAMLTEEERRLLRLFAEGRTHGEIGYTMGLTEGAVKQRFHTLKKRIQQIVAPEAVG